MLFRTDDSQLSVIHRQVGLDHVSNLLVQLLRRHSEVEALEGFTNGGGSWGLGLVICGVVVQDRGSHRILVGHCKPEGTVLTNNDFIVTEVSYSNQERFVGCDDVDAAGDCH